MLALALAALLGTALTPAAALARCAPNCPPHAVKAHVIKAHTIKAHVVPAHTVKARSVPARSVPAHMTHPRH